MYKRPPNRPPTSSCSSAPCRLLRTVVSGAPGRASSSPTPRPRQRRRRGARPSRQAIANRYGAHTRRSSHGGFLPGRGLVVRGSRTEARTTPATASPGLRESTLVSRAFLPSPPREGCGYSAATRDATPPPAVQSIVVSRPWYLNIETLSLSSLHKVPSFPSTSGQWLVWVNMPMYLPIYLQNEYVCKVARLAPLNHQSSI